MPQQTAKTTIGLVEQLIDGIANAPVQDVPRLVDQAKEMLDGLAAKTAGRTAKAFHRRKLTIAREHIGAMVGEAGPLPVAEHAEKAHAALDIAQGLNWV